MSAKSRILIVDDDPIVIGAMSHVLAGEGYEIDTAADGRMALNKLPEFDPDLILLDAMMPELDGFDVCRQLRADDRFGDIPVVFVTTGDDHDTRLRAIDAGADEFISKPVNPAELRARVKTTTRLREVRRMVGERSRFEKIIELAPQGIMVVDDDAKILFSNAALRNMVKVPDETGMRRRKIFHFVPREYREQVDRNLNALLTPEANPISFETELLREDGRRFPAEITAGYFPWERKPCVQFFVRNVEDKKAIEAQFLRMQRMQSIGTLAGGIAHDLNNALTPILVATHLAKGQLRGHTAERLIETVERSATRGKDIIKQILAFARGVEGERRVVQLKYIVNETQKILMETLPRSLELKVSVGEHPSPVLGDATQLHQVLMNLCVNARDAMPDGGELSISLDNVHLEAAQSQRLELPAAGAYVRLSVSDTGTGMDKSLLDQIFEPFFTTKDTGKGTGLGLSSSIGIVRSHGGGIHVTSEVGTGTTFDVYLPAAKSEALESDSYETTFIRKGSGERILVVDDEEAIRSTLQASLRQYGYDVVTAGDGEQAAALLEADPSAIRVVLMDFMMPGLHGEPLLQRLQAADPSTRIILMSGYGEMQLVREVAESNDVRSLVKPFTVEAMLETLQRVLA